MFAYLDLPEITDEEVDAGVYANGSEELIRDATCSRTSRAPRR